MSCEHAFSDASPSIPIFTFPSCISKLLHIIFMCVTEAVMPASSLWYALCSCLFPATLFNDIIAFSRSAPWTIADVPLLFLKKPSLTVIASLHIMASATKGLPSSAVYSPNFHLSRFGNLSILES